MESENRCPGEAFFTLGWAKNFSTKPNLITRTLSSFSTLTTSSDSNCHLYSVPTQALSIFPTPTWTPQSFLHPHCSESQPPSVHHVDFGRERKRKKMASSLNHRRSDFPDSFLLILPLRTRRVALFLKI